MKYLISFASLVSVAFSATSGRVEDSDINTKCNRDNCLRNIIAANLVTRYGYADCTKFLMTTVTPAPVWHTSSIDTEKVIATSTTTTETIIVNYPTLPPQKKREIQDFQRKGFKVVKRVVVLPPEIRGTNTMPDYMVKSCTQLGATLATNRFSSACSCVGLSTSDTTSLAISTWITTVTSTTSTSWITPKVTVVKLKASISGGSAAGKFVATSSDTFSSRILVVATATASAVAADIVIHPQNGGRTYIAGLLLIAEKSSTTGAENTSFFKVIPDVETVSAPLYIVSCQINPVDDAISCRIPDIAAGQPDRSVWISAGTILRLLKEGAPIPAVAGYETGFKVFAVAPQPTT
ncbi:hypothetical protein TWF481_012221 [Arthrobotrys musiformis]|uniref:Uncharacterized protein n=1 Tax=Arthrobotrys musiformis TaxID=47236 RepID=A0AAV9W2H2_9PEZI